MNDANVVKTGGWFIIAFALVYLGIQLSLIMFYNYRAAPHGPDIDSFAYLLQGGTSMQVLLSLFALTPLLLIPGSVGAYYAFRDVNEPGMRIGVLFAVLAAFSLSLCLMRWPTFNWYLARFYGQADPQAQASVGAIFHGLDDYFGLFLGGIFSKVCASIWFFIISATMMRTPGFPKWITYLGYFTSFYLLLTLIEPFNIVPDGVASFINLLTPIEFLWLMALGISLLYYKDVA